MRLLVSEDNGDTFLPAKFPFQELREDVSVLYIYILLFLFNHVPPFSNTPFWTTARVQYSWVCDMVARPGVTSTPRTALGQSMTSLCHICSVLRKSSSYDTPIRTYTPTRITPTHIHKRTTQHVHMHTRTTHHIFTRKHAHHTPHYAGLVTGQVATRLSASPDSKEYTSPIN